MNILITGGAGYIGSVALRYLRQKGHTVSVLDNLSGGHRDAVPGDVAFFHGNLGDFSSLIPEEHPIDAVVHLGALISVGESMEDPESYWHNNVIETTRMLKALRDRSIKKLVFASTAAVYGNPLETPILETAPIQPTNVYGATKLAMDTAITVEAQTHGLAATSLRFFNVAGAYEGAGERHQNETHLIPIALQAAAGERSHLSLFGTDYDTKDGTCVRDYIHVVDLADAMERSLQYAVPYQHAIYNLGNGTGFTNREIIETVESVTGKSITVQETERRSGDPAVLIASSENAQKVLGWTPQNPDLQNIIQGAWDFYISK